VTFARITELNDGYAMFAAGGQSVRMYPSPRGTSMKIRFHESVAKINEILFERGIENHFAIAYGDIRDELKDFAKWFGMEPIIV
jgi:hypothetical protein